MEEPTSPGIGRPVAVLVVDGALVDSLTKQLKSYQLIICSVFINATSKSKIKSLRTEKVNAFKFDMAGKLINILIMDKSTF